MSCLLFCPACRQTYFFEDLEQPYNGCSCPEPDCEGELQILSHDDPGCWAKDDNYYEC